MKNMPNAINTIPISDVRFFIKIPPVFFLDFIIVQIRKKKRGIRLL
jgi:hypothetical protein